MSVCFLPSSRKCERILNPQSRRASVSLLRKKDDISWGYDLFLFRCTMPRPAVTISSCSQSWVWNLFRIPLPKFTTLTLNSLLSSPRGCLFTLVPVKSGPAADSLDTFAIFTIFISPPPLRGLGQASPLESPAFLPVGRQVCWDGTNRNYQFLNEGGSKPCPS